MGESTSIETGPSKTVKAGVVAMLHRLPDDVTYDEILEAINLRREIQQRLMEEVENPNDFVTNEEMKRRVASWQR
jgi:hypothetical protein